MKTKLLRKVRNRFEINYYPNGYDFGNEYETDIKCVALVDTRFWTFNPNPIITRYIINDEFDKEWAFKGCLDSLNRLIVDKYVKYGTRRNKKPRKTEEKLWYKE